MIPLSEQIEMRRAEVLKLAAQGLTQREIVSRLNAQGIDVSLTTVNSDLKNIRQEAKENIRQFIEEILPYQHQLAVSGLDKIIKEAWSIFESETDNKAKLQALNVVSDAIMKKQQVLGDPDQIARAIKTVSQLKAVIKSTSTDTESAEEQIQEATP